MLTKTRVLFVSLAAALLCACASGPVIPIPVIPILDAEFHPTNRGWGSPVWQEDFNGTSLDPAKWVIARFCGGYNQERQCYTDRPDNLHVSGGYLSITAWQEVPHEDDDERPWYCEGDDISAVGPTEVGMVINCPASDPSKPDYAYSSARIHTNVPSSPQAWKYGRIEIRAVMPHGPGTWPAFWMLPVAPADLWPKSGEIDILEAVNLHMSWPGFFVPTDVVQSNVHLCSDNPTAYDYEIDPTSNACQPWSPPAPLPPYYKVVKPRSRQLGQFVGTTPDLTRTLHTYAMEWTDVDMRFFVDDQVLGQVKHGPDLQSYAPFQHPFYLIINLAIGGKWPGPPSPTFWGSPSRRTILRLDWVRVYACGGDPTAKNCAY